MFTTSWLVDAISACHAWRVIHTDLSCNISVGPRNLPTAKCLRDASLPGFTCYCVRFNWTEMLYDESQIRL